MLGTVIEINVRDRGGAASLAQVRGASGRIPGSKIFEIGLKSP